MIYNQANVSRTGKYSKRSNSGLEKNGSMPPLLHFLTQKLKVISRQFWKLFVESRVYLLFKDLVSYVALWRSKDLIRIEWKPFRNVGQKLSIHSQRWSRKSVTMAHWGAIIIDMSMDIIWNPTLIRSHTRSESFSKWGIYMFKAKINHEAPGQQVKNRLWR